MKTTKTEQQKLAKIASLINSLVVAKEFIVENADKKTAKAQRSLRIWREDYVKTYNELIDLGVPMVCGRIGLNENGTIVRVHEPQDIMQGRPVYTW